MVNKDINWIIFTYLLPRISCMYISSMTFGSKPRWFSTECGAQYFSANCKIYNVYFDLDVPFSYNVLYFLNYDMLYWLQAIESELSLCWNLVISRNIWIEEYQSKFVLEKIADPKSPFSFFDKYSKSTYKHPFSYLQLCPIFKLSGFTIKKNTKLFTNKVLF